MSVFPTKILLAIDGSESAEAAAKAASELAQKTDSELHVMHVDIDVPNFMADVEIDPDRISQAARDLVQAQVRRIEDAGGFVTESHLRAGNEAEEIVILSESQNVGLVVIGSRGQSNWKRAVMGNVAEDVVRHAHCPVMVVREEEPRV